MTKSMYDKIKKQNGESFSRTLRDVLDLPNIADIIKYAGKAEQDAKKVLPYLYSLRVFTELPGDSNDPFELLHMAGYEFVEYADTLEKQNAIKKYFRPNEELCTFEDKTRFEKFYIINAIKYNIDSIKPSQKPMRQDEYGTSVISIQILKTGGHISIKNRYNHSVEYPDSTFDNNPDGIIPGLSIALKKKFNVDWQLTGNNLPDNFALVMNKIIKYNYKIGDIYFGENFYALHDKIYEINKDSQVVLDYFIWDNKEKRLLNPSGLDDGFIDAFNTEIKNKKITAKPKGIFADNVEIVRIQNGKIVYVNFPSVGHIGDGFMRHSNGLMELNLTSVLTVKNEFLRFCRNNVKISMPNLTDVGNDFLGCNTGLTEIDLQKLQTIGDNFLNKNTCIVKINFPNVIKIGLMFMGNNNSVMEFYCPKLKYIGRYFMEKNDCLTELYLSELLQIENRFMYFNNSIKKIYFPKVNKIGNDFMHNNRCLTDVVMHSEYIGDNFLFNNPLKNKLLTAIMGQNNIFVPNDKGYSR